jgi:N-acetylmuramoyl-L-alanine amidase
MEIENGWIKDVKKKDLSSAANDKKPTYANNPIKPKRIVLHYSAGSTLKSAVDTLRGKGFAYHVLIDVDGQPYQTRPFTIKAAHAGRSNWKETAGLTNGNSLNDDGIGISFINLGKHAYFNKGFWYYGYDKKAKKYLAPKVADANATKAALVYTPGRVTHWAPFEKSQFDTCKDILTTLIGQYEDISEIMGHHDIAIDEKPDPGPLMPMDDWRKEFEKEGTLGFETEVASPDGTLTLRDRPNVDDGKKIDVLKNGQKVHIRAIPYSSRKQNAIIDDGGPRFLTPWASIDIDGSNSHAGFVLLKYLKDSPLAPAYKKKL